MKAYKTLPENYKEIYSINIQKDKKTNIFVNILSLIIAILMVVPAFFAVPITTFFVYSGDLISLLIKLAIILVSIVIYMVLHEVVHGIVMKLCGTKKIKYGFNGLYAYAGSDDYYDKKSYIIIALAPIVLFGIILGIINALVPKEWFWVVYFIQLENISGAAGDLYVTFKFLKLPNDILVKDSGLGMSVFSVK